MMKQVHRILASSLAATAFATAMHAQQQEGRGIWFWRTPDSPYGSDNVLASGKMEDAALLRLKGWNVSTLYGSYANDGTTNAAGLHEWNRKLHAHGIRSLLLLSETDLLFPEHRAELDRRIRAAYLDFNASSRPEERFDGLAFDVEPHIIPAWKSDDATTRRALLADLLALYQHVRTLLPEHDELEATLPAWFSHTTGSIGWANALDRDDYFQQLSLACNRLSIMAFELDSADKVIARSHEEADLLHGHARIALRAKLGYEWNDIDAFWRAVHGVEAYTGQSVDIQDFAILAKDEDAQH